MSKLRATIFVGAVEVAKGEPLETISVDITGSHLETAAVSGSAQEVAGNIVRKMRLHAEIDCYVAWGENPVADVNSMPLDATNPEYFDIVCGHKISVLAR